MDQRGGRWPALICINKVANNRSHGPLVWLTCEMGTFLKKIKQKLPEETGETAGVEDTGAPLFPPAASTPPRETDFIWRIKQMHLEIALSLSPSPLLSLPLCLLCSLFHILPLSLLIVLIS